MASNQPGGEVASPASGRVLVLGTDTRVVLAIARSLGRQGIEVHVGWLPANSVARRSRYVYKAHELPPYNTYGTAWTQPLLELVSNGHFDLIIPCNDSSVVPLQNCRQLMGSVPGLHLLPDEVFAVAFDKLRSWELARSLGVCVPDGMAISGRGDAETIVGRFALPLILKPRTTYSLARAGSDVVRRANTLEELRQWLASPSFREGVLVQRVFEGAGVGVELLAHQGEILTAFQHRRLHESMAFGSSYRMSVPLDCELLAAARSLIGALRYTGVAMVEFRQNLRTREWAFLEINARFWGSLPLAVAAGADFPYYLYQYHVEGRRQYPQHYRVGVRCRNLELDTLGLASRLRADGHWRPLGLAEELLGGLRVMTGLDRVDNCAADDLWPGIVEFWRLAGGLVSRPFRSLRTDRSEPAQPGAVQLAPIPAAPVEPPPAEPNESPVDATSSTR